MIVLRLPPPLWVLAQRHIATWTQMIAMAGIAGTLAALGLMLARELVTRLK